jgi:hypothetical protein
LNKRTRQQIADTYPMCPTDEELATPEQTAHEMAEAAPFAAVGFTVDDLAEYLRELAAERGIEPRRLLLYYTDALPAHYVAFDVRDRRWYMIPAAPMGSAAWAQRKPYRGNYTLRRVRPTVIEKFYQPPGEPEPADKDAEVETVAMTLDEAAEELGYQATQPVSQLVTAGRLHEYIPPGVQGWESSNRVLVTRESVEAYKQAKAKRRGRV